MEEEREDEREGPEREEPEREEDPNRSRRTKTINGRWWIQRRTDDWQSIVRR